MRRWILTFWLAKPHSPSLRLELLICSWSGFGQWGARFAHTLASQGSLSRHKVEITQIFVIKVMLGVMLEATAWYWWLKVFFATIGFEPPSKDFFTETPMALYLSQRWEHFFLIKFSVECNEHEMAACLANQKIEGCTLFMIRVWAMGRWICTNSGSPRLTQQA